MFFFCNHNFINTYKVVKFGEFMSNHCIYTNVILIHTDTCKSHPYLSKSMSIFHSVLVIHSLLQHLSDKNPTTSTPPLVKICAVSVCQCV